jgi:WD40 repeat protein/DNA-binding SARP family transcriptional activator
VSIAEAVGATASTVDVDCDFGVLGPLVVRGAAGRVSVGGLKEQTVLAMLLAQANQVVPAASLIEGIWGEQVPRTAAKTLQGYVLRLRRALEPNRAPGTAPVVLVTAGDGYQLCLSPNHVDAGRFEQLVNKAARLRSVGDWSGSAATLRTALALWRGDPYGAYVDAPACLLEAQRLTALYEAAREDCIDADVAAGQAAAVVPELERLTRDNPYRERLWGLLMLSLYRSGRQAEALRAYQRARTTLVQEMGIEPGPELRQLEARLLAQDPTLDVAPRARAPGAPAGAGLPAGLAAVGPSFVGRRRELDELTGAWQQAAAGRGGLIVVFGPEGIGKTRLVAELARVADGEGSPVCYARCSGRNAGPDDLVRQLLSDRGLSPADVADPDGDLLGPGPATRLAEFLAGWAVGQPTVVIVDDMHTGGAGGRLIAQLGHACQQLPVLVVAAARDDPELLAMLADAAPAGTATVQLRGLPLDAIVALGSLYNADEWSAADAEAVLQATGGLPLAVHEMISDLARARGGARLVKAAEQAGQARMGLARVQADIAEHVVSLQAAEERRHAHLRTGAMDEPDAGPTKPLVCPYKGLARFESEDSAYFFGRERLVATLTARLVGATLVVVTGPSGSGKSSVVRAGLLPALAHGVLPGSDTWRLITMTPGAHPVHELQRRLGPSVDDSGRQILFVDQFEELFAVRDESERATFVSEMLGLLAREPPTAIILAVRSDELGHCAAYPELAERITGNDVLIGPMSDRELARAIEGPAARAHLRVEAGLAETVIGDVADRPAALPLLSTALLETWERRRGATLTVAGYRDAGGVEGAVARLAESAYARLSPGQQKAARRILLHLADVDPGRPPDIRRRVAVSEVVADDDADAGVALDVLVGRRLLSLGDGTVEVTHEALLREWPRLREWLQADVEGRRLHHQLASQAVQWEESGRHPSELLRGPRLSAALEWAEAHDEDLNAREETFLAESNALAQREVIEARRRADEQLRVNHRLRRRMALLAVVAIVAVVASGVAVFQRGRAEVAARRADALRLATTAVAIPPDQLDHALLVARQAWQLDDSTETRSALLTLLLRSPRLSRFLPGLTTRVDAADVSPDGSTIAVASSDDTVRLFDPRTGRLLSSFPITQTGRTYRVLLSPDARTVATLGGDAVVRLWDRDGHPLGPPLGTGPAGDNQGGTAVPLGAFLSTAAFSPDGRLLATVDETGHGLVWDLGSRHSVGQLPVVVLPRQDASITFSPDGALLAIAAAPSIVVDAHTLRTIFVVPSGATGPDTSIAFNADGRLLATASGPEIRLWDVTTHGPARAALNAGATTTRVEFSPDGRLLAAGTDGGATDLWNAHTFASLGAPLIGQHGAVEQSAFAPGTDLLVTATSSSVAVWDTATPAPLASTVPAPPGLGARAASMALSPRAGLAASAGADGSVTVWHLSAGKLLPLTLHVGTGHAPTALQFSPDGRALAIGTADGSVVVLDPVTGSAARPPDGIGDSRITALAFAGHTGNLAVGTSDGRVIVITPGSRSVHDLAGPHQSAPVTSLAFGPDGSMLASGGDDGYVVLHDLRHGRSTDLLVRSSERVTALSYRPDGRLIVAGYSDGAAVVVEPPDGTQSAPVSVGSAAVNAVAFSPDGRVLAIASADGALSLWDARTYQRLGPSLGEPAPAVTVLAFSPAAKDLVTGTAGGATARWNVDPTAWAARACRLAGRTLTQEEWAELLPGRGYHPACQGGLG